MAVLYFIIIYFSETIAHTHTHNITQELGSVMQRCFELCKKMIPVPDSRAGFRLARAFEFEAKSGFCALRQIQEFSEENQDTYFTRVIFRARACNDKQCQESSICQCSFLPFQKIVTDRRTNQLPDQRMVGFVGKLHLQYSKFFKQILFEYLYSSSVNREIVLKW